jgi:hypothetical protein
MILFVVFLVSMVAWASPEELRPQEPGEKLKDYLDKVVPIDPNAEAKVKADGTKTLVRTTLSEQAVSPAGTANASSFADRVNGTLQNFLPLVQGLVNGINTSDDKKAVTLRLNPIRAETFGELGLTASAKEPVPYEPLLALLPDDSRFGQKENIQKTLGDFTDLTYVATYNYVRKLDLTEANLPRWLFGRNPRLYEELFASLVSDTFKDLPVLKNTALDPFFGRFPREDMEGLTRKELEQRLGVADYDRLVKIMIDKRRPLAALNAKVAERAELFNQLVANQPQATLSATYHDRDPLVGRNETSVDLSFEMPAAPNINEFLRSWRSEKGDWQKALTNLESRTKEIKAGTKWSIVANYREAEGYKVTYQPTTEGAAPVSLDRPRSHELSLKTQYTRNATWQKMKVEGIETFPALHIAAEVIDVSNDPDRQDRRVFTLTYDIPVRKGVSFPVSLVYANRSEFLGQPDRQFGAHVGLSLNSLFGDQGN